MGKRPDSKVVTEYLLSHICLLPAEGLVEISADKFGISRQAIHKRLRKLEADGQIRSEGRTKGKKYFPVWLGGVEKTYDLGTQIAEDHIWSQDFKPRLPELEREPRDLCVYGFTEMLNNAIEHSAGTQVAVEVKWTQALIRISISDNGVGIFRKIQREKGLDDQRHAILELSKGKLTTDPDHHTGEGIFFTSRAFDEFSILSGNLFFNHSRHSGDWLIEDKASASGTLIDMLLMRATPITLKSVFDEHSSDLDGYAFSSTHVPVGLATYGEELLVSRSQARRLLVRFENFKEVMLDFKGVDRVGQAFADEIFRVFRKANPQVKLAILNTSQDVEQMIRRAMGEEFSELGNR